jgi:hypothetical protein
MILAKVESNVQEGSHSRGIISTRTFPIDCTADAGVWIANELERQKKEQGIA